MSLQKKIRKYFSENNRKEPMNLGGLLLTCNLLSIRVDHLENKVKKQNENVKNARTFFFNELKKKGGKQKMSKKRYEKLCLDTCNLFNLTAKNEKREIKIKKLTSFINIA